MTGINSESRVLALGDREMWNLSLDIGATFLWMPAWTNSGRWINSPSSPEAKEFR
jgi:hypothetical protein